MRILITLVGFLNGSYMLFDGYYVMLHNKYFGPPKPGPWSGVFGYLNINVFKLGPLFMVLGIAWVLFVFLIWLKPKTGYWLGLAVAVLTLWYLPVGTVISVVVLTMLLSSGKKAYMK